MHRAAFEQSEDVIAETPRSGDFEFGAANRFAIAININRVIG